MKGNAVLHLIKYWLGLEKAHTQTTENEQACIRKYARNAKNCLEIGVYEGVNTALIAASMLPDGKLYAIDPFFKGTLGICYHEIVAKTSLRRKGLLEKVEFIPKLSFEAGNDVPDDLDFIFVDGDHSLEGIRKDWEIFSRKLKPEGFILLHDTSVPPHDPSVANLGSYAYFNEIIKNDERFSLLETVDSLNVLKRRFN